MKPAMPAAGYTPDPVSVAVQVSQARRLIFDDPAHTGPAKLGERLRVGPARALLVLEQLVDEGFLVVDINGNYRRSNT